MATYPLATLAPTIDATGISIPSFNDVFQSLVASYQSIFGSDVVLTSDSQDGQFIGIIAKAINDSNNAAVATFVSYSPAGAQGAALSSNVKINGIRRLIASSSTVDLLLVGQAGTTITNGIVEDSLGNQWALPATVTIPSGGEITATATCQTIGAIAADVGTVNKIATPTYGWQTASNPAAAAPGAPVESDATLRERQATSTAIPSLTVLEGIVGAVAAIPGVTRYRAYENDTGTVDANGIPAHSISLVVEGGDALTIAEAIAAKKTPGAGTYGTTSETVTDAYGIPHVIDFYRPTTVSLKVAVGLSALAGYTSTIGIEIQTAIASHINALNIGQKVMQTRLFVPANLGGSADGQTFEITSLQLAVVGGTLGTADVAIAFNQVAICDPANIVVTAS